MKWPILLLGIASNVIVVLLAVLAGPVWLHRVRHHEGPVHALELLAMGSYQRSACRLGDALFEAWEEPSLWTLVERLKCHEREDTGGGEAIRSAGCLGPADPADDGVAPLYRPPPAYPPVALSTGEEGRVLIEFGLTPDGYVDALSVPAIEGAIFEEAAVHAVEKWIYCVRADFDPTQERRKIVIPFRLADHCGPDQGCGRPR